MDWRERERERGEFGSVLLLLRRLVLARSLARLRARSLSRRKELCFIARYPSLEGNKCLDSSLLRVFFVLETLTSRCSPLLRAGAKTPPPETKTKTKPRCCCCCCCPRRRKPAHGKAPRPSPPRRLARRGPPACAAPLRRRRAVRGEGRGSG